MNVRMTKKFLMSLPSGNFIASNCMRQDGIPIIAEQVAPLSEREAQWGRIKDNRLSGTTFFVFHDANTFEEHVALTTTEAQAILRRL
ncbi:hypothetical protein [Magnetospirillum sp. 15-1]|uniref:hypothetical protein n=1 Tax=Magnetospirillum sp. 15-1 TaxID=1979370 RepID=UPI001144D909|nr:hypothetical protein [Magnetospirillum sp. 15-1]